MRKMNAQVCIIMSAKIEDLLQIVVTKQIRWFSIIFRSHAFRQKAAMQAAASMCKQKNKKSKRRLFLMNRTW